MLYEFKSRATGTITMTEPVGRKVLEIIGKSPGAHGIVTVAQIPAAIAALEAAVAADEAAGSAPPDEDEGTDEVDAPQRDRVRLRQRAAPFIDMLRRSAAEEHDVVW